MDTREIVTLPIAPIHKTRLISAGYKFVGDFTDVDVEQLSRGTGLNHSECEHLLNFITESKTFVPKSRLGSEIFEKEESDGRIMTFSEKLDEALGGGMQRGIVTEICGLPGVGKTQLCMQLACVVQMPEVFGGVEGEAVYIETDGGLVLERLTDIVAATVKHCRHIASRDSDPDIQNIVSSMAVDKMLAGIHVYSCHDNSQLLGTVELLPEFLKENRKIKVVIIDSVAFHFRHDFDDMSLRTRVLTNLAQTLIRISKTFDVAVVVTNQMTTRVHQGADKGSHIVPCLGESWGHACTCRVILQHENGSRRMWLYKSSSQPQSYTPFQITKEGIRDVAACEPQELMNQDYRDNTETDSSVDNPSKRQRLV
ncbi:DNA repair protein rad51c [Mactra antiquata]